MKSVVKVVWKREPEWTAELLLATENGFERKQLRPGKKLEFELLNERHCTGFIPRKGERVECPEFRKIQSGSQCGECRGKDIYSNYVRGEENNLDGDFSVYLAQCGGEVKVGVTRIEKLERRWVEQGADYAAEIERRVNANKALEIEQDYSSKGLKERVRKESKVSRSDERLSDVLEKFDLEANIVDLSGRTVYPETSCTDFRRSGLFSGELECVKGQMISNGRTWLALGSGKSMSKPVQQGLDSY